MRFLRRAMGGLFLFAVTLGLLALAGTTITTAIQSSLGDERRGPPARERVFSAEVARAEPETIRPTLTAFGEIRSRRTLEVRAPAGGRVIELADGFEDGGAVSEGQLLFRIDPSEAQSSRDTAATDLRQAEDELAEAERALGLAEEDVAAARLQADLRARALARQQDLLDRGVGSAAAVESAELTAATADQAVLSRRQALAQAQTRLDLAGTGLARAEIALAEAERRLAETALHAQFDGVLANVTLVAGRLVSTNEQVAELIDPSALEVAFRVSTAQYGRLLTDNEGLPRAPVTVVLDVFGVDITADAVLTRESGAVAEGQSGRLLFAQLDETSGFRAGDFVTVRVEEPPLENVARLPATALDGENRVLVLGEENRLEEIAVTLLRRQGDDVLVRGVGLFGREVVLARTPVLGAGIRINPLRPGADETAQASAEAMADTVTLDPERRARLIAFVEGNTAMPEDVRQRLLTQLSQDEVPAQLVMRLESRMGG